MVTPANYWANSYGTKTYINSNLSDYQDPSMGLGNVTYDENPFGSTSYGLGGWSNTNSIYGNGYDNTSAIGFTGSGAYGGTAGIQARTPEEYMKQMQKIQDLQDDYSIKRQKKMKGAQFAVQGDQTVTAQAVGRLSDMVAANRQDDIPNAYQKLVTACKAELMNNGAIPQGEENSPQAQAMIKAYAEQQYAGLTGKSLTANIRENGDSSFWAGMKKVMSLGLSNDRTAEENIAQITGNTYETSETASYAAGAVTAGAIGGAVAVGLALLTRGRLKAKVTP